jgi:CRP-like cAMP-binding protein
MNKLTLIEKAFFLKKTALFAEVDLDLVFAISDKAQILSFSRGDLIFSKNQDAHRLYIILDGEVCLYDSDPENGKLQGAQEFFGDEALFNQDVRQYNAQATGPTMLMALSRTHLIEVILESPQVALALLRAYAAVTPFRKGLS